MSKNMGRLDRTARFVIAAVLVVFAVATPALSGALFWIALAVAAVFTLTALVGHCPLYRVIGLSTQRPWRPSTRS